MDLVSSKPTREYEVQARMPDRAGNNIVYRWRLFSSKNTFEEACEEFKKAIDQYPTLEVRLVKIIKQIFTEKTDS